MPWSCEVGVFGVVFLYKISSWFIFGMGLEQANK